MEITIKQIQSPLAVLNEKNCLTFDPKLGGIRGAFTLPVRIAADDFNAVRKYGVTYVSAEDIEDAGTFGDEGGWQFSAGAIVALINLGYTIRIFGTDAVFSTENRAEFFRFFKQSAIDARAAARQEVQAQATVATQTTKEQNDENDAEYRNEMKTVEATIEQTHIRANGKMAWSLLTFVPSESADRTANEQAFERAKRFSSTRSRDGETRTYYFFEQNNVWVRRIVSKTDFNEVCWVAR